MAVRLIGVFCTVESRFSAVTMTSCEIRRGLQRDWCCPPRPGLRPRLGRFPARKLPAKAAVRAMRGRIPRAGVAVCLLFIVLLPMLCYLSLRRVCGRRVQLVLHDLPVPAGTIALQEIDVPLRPATSVGHRRDRGQVVRVQTQ